MRKIPCEQCAIRGTSCIIDLPPERLDEFRECGRSAIYRRRQVIFHEELPADGLYLLCHGAVKLYHSDRFGREHILGVALPGEVLGELPPEARDTYAVSAEALTDVQLSYLPRDALVRFLQDHPLIGVRLIAALSRALIAARRKVRSLAFKPAEHRLAELLIQLAEAGGEAAEDGALRFHLEYTRRELGEMIGVTTETVIRMLARFRRKHLVTVDGRQLTIAAADQLRRLANYDRTA